MVTMVTTKLKDAPKRCVTVQSYYQLLGTQLLSLVVRSEEGWYGQVTFIHAVYAPRW